jgi:hypothetical protein
LLLAPAPLRGDDALEEHVVKTLGRIEGDPDDAVLSPAGDRLACIVGDYGSMTVVCDGKQQSTFADVKHVRFSSDGKHLSYAALMKPRWVVVVDGKELGTLSDWQATFAFSPNGKHVVYVGKDADGDKCLMYDTRTLRVPGPGQPVFSSNGRHVACTCHYERAVWVDGKIGPTYDKVRTPVFAPGGLEPAYAFFRKDRWFVKWRRRDAGPYTDVGDLHFSTDGRRLAWRAKMGDKWCVVVNGTPGPLFNDVSEPCFCRGGKRIGYAGRTDGGWCVVIDHRSVETCLRVCGPAFGSFGKTVAWAAERDNGCVLVCEGRELPIRGRVSRVCFDASGRHLIAVVETFGTARVLCDGRRGPEHAAVILPERYDAEPGKFRYVAVDGGSASLVALELPADRTWEHAFVEAEK